MNKQKGLAPILIILLIAAAVGGYLMYTKYSTNQTNTPQQTIVPQATPSDETANWKTYTNDNYNLTFDYPDSWIIGEDDGKKSRGVPLIFLRPKSMQTQDKTYGEVIIWTYNNIKTIEELLVSEPNPSVYSLNLV